MGYVGTWGLQGAKTQLPAGSTWRFEFFTLPPLVGDQHRFVQDAGWAFAVPNTSRNPRAAWAVAKALALSPEAMRRWSAITGALPALYANATPAAAAAAAESHPALAKVQPLLEHGRWRGYIPSPALQSFDGALLRNFFEVVDGTKLIPAALLDVQTIANEAIARHSN
jgi:ABC-type glycerol-3-phosphate transport system substrate-binding protein